MDISTFHAPVYNAIVNDPSAETGKRDAQYIPATCIPEDILEAFLGYGMENPRHPYHIRGMSWDLTVNNWRNMKNAEPLDNGPTHEVVADLDSDYPFILS